MSWVSIIHGRLSCDPPFNGYNGFSHISLYDSPCILIFLALLHLYTVLCTLLRVRLDDHMIPTSLILCLLFCLLLLLLLLPLLL